MEFSDFLALDEYFAGMDSAVLDKIFEDDNLDNILIDAPVLMGGHLIKSRSILQACPNMPRWENAWWGEKAMENLPPSMEEVGWKVA